MLLRLLPRACVRVFPLSSVLRKQKKIIEKLVTARFQALFFYVKGKVFVVVLTSVCVCVRASVCVDGKGDRPKFIKYNQSL